MRIRSKLYQCIALIALTGMMNGCGGGGSSSSSSSYVQTGKLVQGPVTDATVYADRVKTGIRFVKDDSELSTQSVNGNYSLTVPSNYGDYILVSKGGTDQITGLPAIQMLAPAGSANITPLTTLVALDTTNPTLLSTKGVIAKLNILLPAGVGYDANISVDSSPAVLLLAKSIETATKQLTDAIISKSGNTISPQQNSYIQAQIMQSIALTLASAPSSLDLSVPTNVNTLLKNSIDQAIISINTDNAANIQITNVASATAILIADGSVNAAATALSVSDQSVPLITKSKMKEADLANAAIVFQAAVAADVIANIGTTITAADTPNTYSPPEISVVTVTISAVITGAIGSTGSSGTGTQF